MNLEELLPLDLRGPATTITRIAAGLSGAGVHRVEAAGRSYVLKVAGEGEDPADWQRALHAQKLAAEAGLTPRVVHADEQRRAVVTDFVADRSFMTFYRDPRTHEAALAQLGRTVRRIHALPLPPGALPRDPREIVAMVRDRFLAGFAIPGFVSDAIARVLAEDPPGAAPVVLGHNDLNPSNLVYDGEAILVLDWAVAAPVEAFYDLAVVSLFLRMDEATSLRLLSAYEERTLDALPARFRHMRRVAGALAGSFSLHLARQMKHPGATGAETMESALPLLEFYQQMRAGALKLGSAEGQWTFGLALVKESFAI
jgi:aminoglycoside phosphotransferase (APT) family kinase protein